MRHAAAIEALRAAVLEGPGALRPEARRAIFEGGGPEELQPYLDKVRRHAYRVTDADVEALRGAWSDDQLFEATVAAALGEGLRRLG